MNSAACIASPTSVDRMSQLLSPALVQKRVLSGLFDARVRGWEAARFKTQPLILEAVAQIN